MNWPGLDTIVGAVAGFILAALGVLKLWRDSARNTEAIALEGRERKADITDLRNRTDERLAEMSTRFDELHKCLAGMRDDLCRDRLDMTKNYVTKTDAREMRAEAEKTKAEILGAIKELRDHSDKRFQMAFESMKGREAR